MTDAKFKAWYIPQIPGEAFEVEVDSPAEGFKILDIISRFSLFEFENRVKPDYADAGGVVEWDESEQDWWDVDEDEMGDDA